MKPLFDWVISLPLWFWIAWGGGIFAILLVLAGGRAFDRKVERDIDEAIGASKNPVEQPTPRNVRIRSGRNSRGF